MLSSSTPSFYRWENDVLRREVTCPVLQLANRKSRNKTSFLTVSQVLLEWSKNAPSHKDLS